MKDHLHKNGLEITSSTKKNLRRNIENTFGNNIKFIKVNHNELWYHHNLRQLKLQYWSSTKKKKKKRRSQKL